MSSSTPLSLWCTLLTCCTCVWPVAVTVTVATRVAVAVSNSVAVGTTTAVVGVVDSTLWSHCLCLSLLLCLSSLVSLYPPPPPPGRFLRRFSFGFEHPRQSDLRQQVEDGWGWAST